MLPPGAEPLRWRLLTSHEVTSTEDAWRIVRLVQAALDHRAVLPGPQGHTGFKLEDSQIGLCRTGFSSWSPSPPKLPSSPCSFLQARNGQPAIRSHLPSMPARIAAAQRSQSADRSRKQSGLGKPVSARTASPWAAWDHRPASAAWDGYPSSKPPGPITFRHGLEHFHTNRDRAGSSETCACPSAFAGTHNHPPPVVAKTLAPASCNNRWACWGMDFEARSLRSRPGNDGGDYLPVFHSFVSSPDISAVSASRIAEGVAGEARRGGPGWVTPWRSTKIFSRGIVRMLRRFRPWSGSARSRCRCLP